MIRKTDAANDFDQTFLAHYAALSRLLYRVTGDSGRAEELASEAFWKLHSNPPPSRHNLRGWLYRTGLNLALDHLKKRKRRVYYEARTPSAAPMRTPEEAVELLERQARVRSVLAELKPQQASLLLLRSEGHTLLEIALFLHIAPPSVGTLLARADTAFRKEYVDRYGEF